MIPYKNTIQAKSRPQLRAVSSCPQDPHPQAGSASVPPGEEEGVPLFQKARAILGARLSYHVDTGVWAVDGHPLPIADVIALANTLQIKQGKQKLLAYPRVATRYDYGLSGMLLAHT